LAEDAVGLVEGDEHFSEDRGQRAILRFNGPLFGMFEHGT
jgi:hypothetical protein